MPSSTAARARRVAPPSQIRAAAGDPEGMLAAHIEIAEADVAGALSVFPLLSTRAPALSYLSFAAAVARGATVKELAGGASVNDLVVHNPLDVPVLLYEGEEVLGAQQNRTFDVSVLVAAGSTLRVPVSCVEAGRWDGARHDEAFAPAPQAAHPRLRRIKQERARAGGGVQAAVWDEVAAKAASHGVASPTSALHDVFERRRSHLRAVAGAVPQRRGQVGMLAAIGGRFVVLDHVSDPEAFAALHGPLVQGYALDALDAPEAASPSIDDAREFAALLLRAPATAAPAVGLGEGLRFGFGGLAGTALACEGELVALTAFASEPGAVAGRVRRPSQRRH